MIKANPDAFFTEMGESLLLIGDEVRPTDFVEDRIDLLAVDQQGALVVVELKRGSNKLQLLQALSYAGMISKWEYSQVVARRQQPVVSSRMANKKNKDINVKTLPAKYQELFQQSRTKKWAGLPG